MPKSVPIEFQCEGCSLIGMFEEADSATSRGVVIVVGGPQYRVGSHRQFTLLSRELASSGLTTMRFDHRGIGDSDGESTFERIGPDIAAAVDAFFAAYPNLTEVVLWGLCDAASAILMYAAGDPRVSGVVALNPWVRSEETLAQSYLSTYYVASLLKGDFWRRLVSGDVNVVKSARDLLGNLRAATSSRSPAPAKDAPDAGPAQTAAFQIRMVQGLKEFDGNLLFILSGKDITANEFRIYMSKSRQRRRLLTGKKVQVHEFPEADHTFSTAQWRGQIAKWSVDWIDSW